MSRHNKQKDDFVLEFLFLCSLLVATWGCYILMLENANLLQE
jgi:hypothetical protein